MNSVSNDGKVKIWDLRKGAALYSLFGHSGGVNSVKFSQAGDFFCTGGEDKSILVWKSNFFESQTTEQIAILAKKKVIKNQVVQFSNKAIPETAEEILKVDNQEIV